MIDLILEQLYEEWIENKSTPLVDYLIDSNANRLLIDAVRWVTQMGREPLTSTANYQWWMESSQWVPKQHRSNLPSCLIGKEYLLFEDKKEAYTYLIEKYIRLKPEERESIQDWEDKETNGINTIQ